MGLLLFIGNTIELIIDVVLAFFTGGGSAAAKITRLASKADEFAKKGIKLSRDVGRRVAASSAEVLQWIKKELAELIEALKSGEFMDYIKAKMLKLFDDGTGKNKLSSAIFKQNKYLSVEQRKILEREELLVRQAQENPKMISSRKKADGTFLKDKDFRRQANIGEMSVNVDLFSKYPDIRPLHSLIGDIDDPIKRGIDHLFVNEGTPPPPRFFVVETKYGSSSLSSYKFGKQMDKRWILDRVRKTFKDKPELLFEFHSLFKKGEIGRFLARIDKDGGIIYELLDDEARVITSNFDL